MYTYACTIANNVPTQCNYATTYACTTYTHMCMPPNTFSKHVGEMIKIGKTSLPSVCLLCHSANEHLSFTPLLCVYSRLLS